MTTKSKLTIISILRYCAFIIFALFTDVLSPAKIGITWTIFWYIAAAGIIYYLWFKNLIFQRVMYFSKALGLTQTDLAKMLPNLKPSQVVPDPSKPAILAPVFTFPLQGLDILNAKLTPMAKEKGIKPFR
ncbi:hypothetical protein FAM21835_00406 [Lentilactobacillus parabuchneri]|uniref:hypothetical protein n=1 Tax=Lentilactobacillus parabuchneri TaxID=152331 RepID=UPI000A0FAC2B|nr:hypothetical protein [Lentilactobacillus parabuchneri]ORN29138.1 hypothetical protein FAM21835_00406 [Lentilactobacillus parabuchneri]